MCIRDSHTTQWIPIAAIFADINAKLDIFKTLDERLTKVKSTRDQIPPSNNWHNTDPPNPNAQYLKSIKIDVPNFDGYHDPQFFMDWTLQLDWYFSWYELTDSRKIKSATIKLSGQANQYWTNLGNRLAARGWPLIDTWDRMKEELETKYDHIV